MHWLDIWQNLKRIKMAEETQTKIDEKNSLATEKRVSILVRIDSLDNDFSSCVKSLSNQILDDMEILFLVTIPSNEDAEGLSEEALIQSKVREKHRQEKLELLDDYAKKDSRIKVVRTKISDYGKIMNAAIKFSKGEYIGIVRSTDYVDPEMYIELFALAKKHDADIVRSNYYEHQNDSERLHESFLAEDADKVINPVDDTSIFYQPPVVGCGLYKKEFIMSRHILFIEDFAADNQDDTFSFKSLAASERLVVTNKAYLHHVEVTGLIEKTKKKKAKKKRDADEDGQEDSSQVSDNVANVDIFLINKEYAEAEKYLKKYNGWETYGCIFQAVKFASYFYTMLHLDDRDLEKFMLRARAEFHDADENDKISKRYFPKEHWKTLQAILNYPPRIFLRTIKKQRKNAV